MGVGRGERNYVLGTQNIFQLKSAKQEPEAKFGTRERGNANLGTRKKSFEKARGNSEREEEMKECGLASLEGPAGTRARPAVDRITVQFYHLMSPSDFTI